MIVVFGNARGLFSGGTALYSPMRHLILACVNIHKEKMAVKSCHLCFNYSTQNFNHLLIKQVNSKCGYNKKFNINHSGSVLDGTCNMFQRKCQNFLFSSCSVFHSRTFKGLCMYHTLQSPKVKSTALHKSKCMCFTHQHRKYSSQRRCKHVYSMVPSSLRFKPPWRVLFFGTDDFSLETLKTLNENRLYPDTQRLVDTLDVVAMKKEVPVRMYAREQGLTVLDWPPQVSPFDYDVGVLVSFGHLIPERIIHMFPYGILNVHPSLLPRWRGAAPIIYTILNGDQQTGISIMEIRPKHFDIGPILLQKKYTVPENFTSFQLRDMMAPLGAQALLEALSDLPALERFEVEQGSIGVTYAHKLTKAMAFIDWRNQTCADIDRQYRAIHELVPLRSTFDGKVVQLLGLGDINSVNDDIIEKYVLKKFKRPTKDVPFGTPLYSKVKDLLLIKCLDGWVGFKEIVFQRRLPAKQFNNGHLSRPIHSKTVFQSVDNLINEDIYSERVIAREG